VRELHAQSVGDCEEKAREVAGTLFWVFHFGFQPSVTQEDLLSPTGWVISPTGLLGDVRTSS
jgi:hypothetical protein